MIAAELNQFIILSYFIMPESQKLPKNATLAFKETHKKHSDTLESEALVDGARYSNKQISTAT